MTVESPKGLISFSDLDGCGGYYKPQRGCEAELSSLRFQAGRSLVQAFPEKHSAAFHRACDTVSASLSRGSVPWLAAPSVSLDTLPKRLEECRLSLIGSDTHDARSGYPYNLVAPKKGEWLGERWPVVVERVTALVKFLLSADEAACYALSAEQFIEMFGTVQLFVKQEPHDEVKAKTGRLRLIASVNLTVVVTDMVFYAEAVEIAKANWTDTGYKPGMGLSPDQMGAHFAWFRRYREPMSLDVSGWDFSCQGWLFLLALSCLRKTFRGGRADEWCALARKYEICLFRPVFQVSGDGRGGGGNCLRWGRDGIMLSGRWVTSFLNSLMQLIMLSAAAYATGRTVESDQNAMGDDGNFDGWGTGDVVSFYRESGFLPKPIVKGVEFCSHNFDLGAGIVVYNNYGKSLANFLQRFRKFPHVWLLEDHLREMPFAPQAGVVVQRLSDAFDLPVSESVWESWRATQARRYTTKECARRPPLRGTEAREKPSGWWLRKIFILFAFLFIFVSMTKNGNRPATKKSGLPKRDLRDIEAAAAAGARKLAKAQAPKSSAPGEVNSYLAGAADPKRAGKGSKIPDGETIPSVAFQTSLTDSAATDIHGRLLAFHAPTLSNGGFHPALTATSAGAAIWSIDPASPSESAVTYTNYRVHDIVPQQTLGAIRRNFAAVRPVSMVIDFTPTEAALTAQGFVYAGLASREQSPANIITSGAGVVGPGQLVGMQAVTGINDLISGAQYKANVTKKFSILWRAEDEQDYSYREATMDHDQSVAVSNGGSYASVSLYSRMSCFVEPAVVTDSSGNENLWWIPGGFRFDEDNNGVPNQIGIRPEADLTYPSVFWGVEGGAPSSTIGEITFTINWEGIPVAGTQAIMSSTPSPTSPLELAQAQNVLPAMPVAFDPDNKSQPENQLVTAVAKVAAEDVTKPAAVKGRSFFSKAAGMAARGLSTVLPFPLSIVASGAESLISALSGP